MYPISGVSLDIGDAVKQTKTPPMKWEKLFCANIAIVSAFFVTLLIPQTAFVHAVIRSMRSWRYLKCTTPKALAFFLPSKSFLLNYTLLKIMESTSGTKAARRARKVTSDLVHSSFLIFMSLVCAYIFKVDAEYLLKTHALASIATYGMVWCSLMRLETLGLFFLFCIITLSALVFGFTFLHEFSQIHSGILGYSRGFRFNMLFN